jgi:hypothetical protein
MKKTILLTLIIISFFATNSFAQISNSDKFSFGLESALPDLKFSDHYSSIAIGGSLKFDKYITGNLYLTGSAQYLYFPYNSTGKAFDELLAHEHGPGIPVDPEFTHNGDSFVTFMIGAKYYFSKKIYGEGQVGIEAVGGTFYGNSGSLVFSPGFGYDVGGGFDVGLRYQGWTESSILKDQLTLRVAFSLGTKNFNKPKNDRRY